MYASYSRIYLCLFLINIQDDLPMICETCLGQNPFVRMVKLPYGDKLCKITGSPYQAFRWKAGPAGRYKETIIGYTVAAERNICQVCLNDMKYGLPVGLRDRLLSDQRTGALTGTVALPQSDVGLQYYYQQQAQLVASGDLDTTSFAADMQNLPASRQLQQFSQSLKTVEQSQPGRTAFRNLPKLCSFWLNGMCNRVVRKTCPFRPCCGPTAYAFPEIAGSHKELHKKLVEQLTEKGPAALQKCMDADIKQALSLAIRGTNRDEAIRKRVTGDDDLSNQYMNKMRNMVCVCVYALYIFVIIIIVFILLLLLLLLFIY